MKYPFGYHDLYLQVSPDGEMYKIGRAEGANKRARAVHAQAFKMELLFYVRFINKHKTEVLESTDGQYDWIKSDWCNQAKRIAQKWETYFVKRYKGATHHGREWIIGKAIDVKVMERMFRAIAKSEESALIETQFTFQKSSPSGIPESYRSSYSELCQRALYADLLRSHIL